MEERCEFLLANPPACDQTYAESLGSKFDTFQVVYAVVSVLLCVPTFYYTGKLVRARGFLKKIGGDSQRRIFYLCSFICLTLLVRSVDPAGWRKWLPILVAGLCLDLATAAVFSLVINLVHDWTQLTLRVTNRRHLLVPVRRLFAGLHAYTWVLLLVTGAVQNSVNRIWFWRALKLYLLAVLLFALSVTLAVVGIMIWRFLSRNEKKHASSSSNLRKGSVGGGEPAAASTGGGGSAASAGRSLRGSVAIRSSSRAGSMAGGTSRRKRSKVNRILKLLVPMLVLAVLTLLLQMATAQTLVDDKFTRESPDEPPTTVGDILVEASFEMVQVLATLITVYFFRPRNHRGTDSETSGGLGGSSNRGGSGRLQPATRPRNSTTTTTMSDVQLDEAEKGAKPGVSTATEPVVPEEAADVP